MTAKMGLSFRENGSEYKRKYENAASNTRRKAKDYEFILESCDKDLAKLLIQSENIIRSLRHAIKCNKPKAHILEEDILKAAK